MQWCYKSLHDMFHRFMLDTISATFSSTSSVTTTTVPSSPISSTNN